MTRGIFARLTMRASLSTTSILIISDLHATMMLLMRCFFIFPNIRATAGYHVTHSATIFCCRGVIEQCCFFALSPACASRIEKMSGSEYVAADWSRHAFGAAKNSARRADCRHGDARPSLISARAIADMVFGCVLPRRLRHARHITTRPTAGRQLSAFQLEPAPTEMVLGIK